MAECLGVVDAIKSSSQQRALPAKTRWRTLRNGPLAQSTRLPWRRNSPTRLRRGLAGASAVVPYTSANLPARPSLSRKSSNLLTDKASHASLARLSKRQLLQILHRLVTLASAVLYLVIALEGVISTLETLVGVPNPPLASISSYDTSTIGTLVGSTAIHSSPLVQQLLLSQTTARNDTMYIDLDGYVSFSKCPQPSKSDEIYRDSFLRQVYSEIVLGAAHSVPFLDPSASELVLPVVDCSSGAIKYDDTSVAKIFYLVRNLSPAPELQGSDDVALVVVTMSNQVYEAPNQDERGPFSAVTLRVLFDVGVDGADAPYHFLGATGFPFKKLRYQAFEHLSTTPESHWKLRVIPRDASEVAEVLLTTCRTGFYWNSPSYQSNINQELWELPSDPLTAITSMQWRGVAVTQNTWAWVHLIHLVFDLQTSTQLAILVLVIYRNWQLGKLWVGDAFSPIASALMLRGGCVLISWAIDGLWTLTEYSMALANRISGVEEVFVHESVLHADLMTVFLMMAGLAGKALHARVDPPLAMLLFELGFHLTKHVLESVPSVARALITKSEVDYALGVVWTEIDTSGISPMGLWSAHELRSKDGALIATVLCPLLLAFALLVAVVLGQKASRVVSPRRCRSSLRQERTGSLQQSKRSTADDESESGAQAQGYSASTQFELATGVELAHRYGVLCDYESARVVKGLTFASADGVYSCGFVVVHERFLVATTDLAPILLMKLLRLRYRNVYVYDVQGHDVQAMARLVYPHTFSFRDLARLNINLLS